VVTMPLYEARREIDVHARASECFTVLTNYERMPEWQSRVVDCRVLSRYDGGRASEVEYALDAELRTVRYRLRHLYDEPEWIGSEYLGGDFRRFEGAYSLNGDADSTHVEFVLRIDPVLRVPRPVARLLNEAVMGRSLDDLKARVETVASGTQ